LSTEGVEEMIKEVNYRQAIICSLKDSGEYIYKDYSNEEQLQRGIERFKDRCYNSHFRVAKIKITVEEVE